jgi:hypothetical protein
MMFFSNNNIKRQSDEMYSSFRWIRRMWFCGAQLKFVKEQDNYDTIIPLLDDVTEG